MQDFADTLPSHLLQGTTPATMSTSRVPLYLIESLTVYSVPVFTFVSTKFSRHRAIMEGSPEAESGAIPLTASAEPSKIIQKTYY